MAFPRRGRARLAALPLAALLVAGWLVPLPVRAPAPPPPARAQAGYHGTLAVGRPDGLWLVPLDGGAPSRLVAVEGGPFITAVAWAPDGSRIAYTRFSFAPGNSVGGADLHLVDLRGDDRLLLARYGP